MPRKWADKHKEINRRQQSPKLTSTPVVQFSKLTKKKEKTLNTSKVRVVFM